MTYNTCEGCEIILSGTETWNSPSEDNPSRCLQCLHYEDNIKDNCGICDQFIYYNAKDYLQYGNVCRKCMKKINDKMEADLEKRRKEKPEQLYEI